jgi:hypothetical protein
MLNTRVVKSEEGWAVYIDKKWIADFTSKALALYFERLLDSDLLLQHLATENHW